MLDRTSSVVGSTLDIAGVLAGALFALIARRHMGQITIPVELPKEYVGYAPVVNALRQQSIAGQDNVVVWRTLQYALLRLIPDTAIVSMNPRVRGIAIENALWGGRVVAVGVLLVIGAIFAPSLSMVPIVATALIAGGYFVWLVRYFQAWGGTPTTRHRNTSTSQAMGNPHDLFKQVFEPTVRELHGGAGPIRLIMNGPAIGTEERGIYSAMLLFESQPRIIQDGTHPELGPIVFPIGAVAFIADMAVLHFGLTGYSIGFPLFFLVLSTLALSLYAMFTAWRVDAAFRFRSELLVIDAEGTFSQTETATGSKHDSHAQLAKTIRASAQISYYSAEAISEADGILEERQLVGLRATPGTGDLIELFKVASEGFFNRGVAQVGIRSDQALADIVGNNLQVSAARAGLEAAAIRHAGYDPTPIANTPQPTSQQKLLGETAGATKRCPECAEDVKAAARKCRFCNYTFEAA